MWKAYFTREWIVLEAKVLGFRWVGGAEIKMLVFYLIFTIEVNCMQLSHSALYQIVLTY